MELAECCLTKQDCYAAVIKLYVGLYSKKHLSYISAKPLIDME